MRNKMVSLRISDEEKKIIEENSSNSSMSLSEYMISCSLSGKKIKVIKETIFSYEEVLDYE